MLMFLIIVVIIIIIIIIDLGFFKLFTFYLDLCECLLRIYSYFHITIKQINK